MCINKNDLKIYYYNKSNLIIKKSNFTRMNIKRCKGKTKNGDNCKLYCSKNEDHDKKYCDKHQPKNKIISESLIKNNNQCKSLTKKNEPCKKKPLENGYCSYHQFDLSINQVDDNPIIETQNTNYDTENIKDIKDNKCLHLPLNNQVRNFISNNNIKGKSRKELLNNIHNFVEKICTEVDDYNLEKLRSFCNINNINYNMKNNKSDLMDYIYELCFMVTSYSLGHQGEVDISLFHSDEYINLNINDKKDKIILDLYNEYKKLEKLQLKIKCKENKLPQTGNKDDLIQRLINLKDSYITICNDYQINIELHRIGIILGENEIEDYINNLKSNLLKCSKIQLDKLANK